MLGVMLIRWVGVIKNESAHNELRMPAKDPYTCDSLWVLTGLKGT